MRMSMDEPFGSHLVLRHRVRQRELRKDLRRGLAQRAPDRSDGRRHRQPACSPHGPQRVVWGPPRWWQWFVWEGGSGLYGRYPSFVALPVWVSDIPNITSNTSNTNPGTLSGSEFNAQMTEQG